MTVYPRRVRKGSDGIYRWSYDEALTFGNPLFTRSLILGVVVGAIVCAAILFIDRNWLVQALIAFVVIVALPTMVWTVNIKFLRMHIHGEYEMGEDYISVVGAINKERHEFKDIKSIFVDARHDTIELKDGFIGTRVMVNEDDIDMVQGFIKEHAAHVAVKTK